MSHTSTMSVLVTFRNLRRQAPQTMANLSRCARAAAELGGPSGADRLEFVLIDDASDDGTPEVLAERLPQLPNARIHVNEGNAGVGASRNTAMELAGGDFLAFLDGDDFVDPTYYIKVLDAITELDCDFVRTDHIEVVGKQRTLRRIPDRNRSGRVGNPRDSITPAHLITAIDHPNVWAGAFHKSLAHREVAAFRPDLQASEDRLWTWQLFLGAKSFSIPEAIGPHYRRDIPTSLSRVADGRQLDSIVAMDAIIELVSADAEAERFLPKAVRRHLEMGLHTLNESSRFGRSLAATFRKRLADSIVSLPEPYLSDTLAALGPERRQRLTTLMKSGTVRSRGEAGAVPATPDEEAGQEGGEAPADATPADTRQAGTRTADTQTANTQTADTRDAAGDDGTDDASTPPERTRRGFRRNR